MVRNKNKPKTMQSDQPEAPSGECLNFEAYVYESGTKCDTIWSDWDNWCWSQDVQAYEDYCQPVEDNLNRSYAESLDADRPEGECLNWLAYNYLSETECDQVWLDWDAMCAYWFDEECWAVEEDMAEVEWLNLAKTDASASDSSTSFGTDFVKGASIGAVAALGAIYVLSKCCNKSFDSGDFHRV